MVREELALSLKELPERKLMAIWLALDQDHSGLISAGEFGAFMRLGEGAATHAPASEDLAQDGEQGACASTLKFVDVAWRARVLKEKQRQATLTLTLPLPLHLTLTLTLTSRHQGTPPGHLSPSR